MDKRIDQTEIKVSFWQRHSEALSVIRRAVVIVAIAGAIYAFIQFVAVDLFKDKGAKEVLDEIDKNLPLGGGIFGGATGGSLILAMLYDYYKGRKGKISEVKNSIDIQDRYRISVFGIENWKSLGKDIAVAPPLPMHLEEELERVDPFDDSKKVRDIYELILVTDSRDENNVVLPAYWVLVRLEELDCDVEAFSFKAKLQNVGFTMPNYSQALVFKSIDESREENNSPAGEVDYSRIPIKIF